MIRFDLSLKNLENCHVPNSDGYLLFSCLSHLLPEETSDEIHEYDGITHISSLSGHFGKSKRKGRKKMFGNKKYDCSINLIGYDDSVEKDIKKYLLIDDPTLEIGDASMHVVKCEVEEKDFDSILENAGEKNSERIEVSFVDPTILSQYKKDITEIFPRRDDFFLSLLSKWNHVADTELKLSRKTILKNTFSEVRNYDFNSHNVVIKHNDKNNVKRHGFTGNCTYNLSKAGEAESNAMLALAEFSEYSGVGVATSRGFGNVFVDFM